MKETRSGILSAGNLLLDHVFLMDHFPSVGTLTTISYDSRCVGGAVLNVLITLSKMGVSFPLAAAGIVGEDENADYIYAQLGKHAIDSNWVHSQQDALTSYTHVMTAKDTGQRTFFHDLGTNPLLDVDFFAPIKSNHKIFHLGYLLLLAGLDTEDKDYGTKSARLCAQMKEKGYLISLDLVSVPEPEKFQKLVKPCLPYVDYLVINEMEASMLARVEVRDEKCDLLPDHIKTVLSNLLNMGVKKCVAIHAPEGGYAMNYAGDFVSSPSYPLPTSEIKGTVGAGDAFCAGMLYALHEGLPLVYALKMGNACAWFNLHAANSVDGTVSLDQVKQFIDEHDRRSRSN